MATTPPLKDETARTFGIPTLILFAGLPVGLLTALLYLRSGAGPFWQWNLLDPSYFYLLDGLNVVHGRPPGHIAHPGVTLEVLNAILMRIRNWGLGADELTGQVLADPESHLLLFSGGLIALIVLCHWVLGVLAYRAFRDPLPALAVQLAPIMSTIVLKHAFVPRPESMVVVSTLILMAVLVTAFRPGSLNKYGFRYALAFGAAAGFAGATKVTSVPVYILPLLVFSGWRLRISYLVAAAGFFLVFMIPAWGAFPQFAEWIGKVAMGAGAHGEGAATVINVDYYPKAFSKVLKRPSLRVPIVLALITLGLVWWHRRRGGEASTIESRVLAVVTVSQLAQAIVVAKHPVVFYMIPSYMLSALSILLSVRLLWSLRPAVPFLDRWGRLAGMLAVAGFVIAQVAATYRLDNELSRLNRTALALDNNRFGLCSRVYIYAASSPVFAMFLADEVTGNQFAGRLATLYPGNHYWIEDWYDQMDVTFRNWDGPQDFGEVLSDSQCLFMRGNRPGGIDRFITRHAPGLEHSKTCSAGVETVATVGVDCEGNIEK